MKIAIRPYACSSKQGIVTASSYTCISPRHRGFTSTVERGWEGKRRIPCFDEGSHELAREDELLLSQSCFEDHDKGLL